MILQRLYIISVERGGEGKEGKGKEGEGEGRNELLTRNLDWGNGGGHVNYEELLR